MPSLGLWRVVVVVVACAAIFVGSNGVLAHGKLKSSIPAAGSTVTSAPTRVVAVFDNHDPLKAESSVLRVTDANGASVDMSDTALDKADAERKTLTVSLKNGLGNGTYTVNWTAVSSGDNSSEQGDFAFTINTDALPSAALPATSGESLPWSMVLLGGVVLLMIGLCARRKAIRSV